MNESALIKCVQKPTNSQLSLTHHANKSSHWAEYKHEMVWESMESVRYARKRSYSYSL